MIKRAVKFLLKKTLYPVFNKAVCKVLRSNECRNVFVSSPAFRAAVHDIVRENDNVRDGRFQTDLSFIKLQSMATLKRIQQEMAGSSVENFET